VIMHLCIAGATLEPFLIITMLNCVISNVSFRGGGDLEPSMNMQINYEDIKIEYKAYKDGKVTGTKTAHWNLKTNKA
jgi:type VI protein secretion system component Hcp